MTSVKILRILLLLSVLCVVNSSKLIYRKYEKKHPRKNYVQVVEIFETRRAPPHFIQSDKELNDFLARDSYSTDMNCTKANGTEDVEMVTKPSTTTTTKLPTIPTTAFRRATSPTTRAPNLNNLFTIRSTKPTIKPNPRENDNPDYTNLLPWPNTNVQVTKHPPSTIKPTIMIKETDERTASNKSSNGDTNKDSELLDDEVIYVSSGEEIDGVDDDYSEQNYPDTIPPEQFEPTEDAAGAYTDNEDYDDADDNNDEFDDERTRRKRHKRLQLTPLRTSKRRRHNQLSENIL